jgi:hypothetical protein
MTDHEAIGKAHHEKKAIEGELKTLRIKADRYAEYFSLLGKNLKGNAAGVVFDDQSSGIGIMEDHFDSSAFDICEVKEIVAKIREKESRLSELNFLLG